MKLKRKVEIGEIHSSGVVLLVSFSDDMGWLNDFTDRNKYKYPPLILFDGLSHSYSWGSDGIYFRMNPCSSPDEAREKLELLTLAIINLIRSDSLIDQYQTILGDTEIET